MNHTVAWIFWSAGLLILYTYFGFPFWLWIRSRLFARPWLQQESFPTVSIVLAVYNGGKLLNKKIQHLLALDYPADRLEIIVVSDGSSDETNAILMTTVHPRLRAFIMPEHRGKAAALNMAMTEARGDILVFNDLRPELEPRALTHLISNFADPSVGCAAGELFLERDNHDPGAAAVGAIYWRYEQQLRIWESTVDSLLGVYGGFYAIRRDLASLMPEGLILDDMYQPLGIVKKGYRSVIDIRARVFDIWPKTSHAEFSRKVRTLAGNLQLIQLAPWLFSPQNRLRLQFVSHKLLRLTIPFLLTACLTACVILRHHAFYLTCLIVQVIFYLLGFTAFVIDVPALATFIQPPAAFCLLNAAVVVGIWKFLFMRRPLWHLWLSTESSDRVFHHKSGPEKAKFVLTSERSIRSSQDDT